MKKGNKRSFGIAICMLLLFVVWTVLVKSVDVRAIGPQKSFVGFATINKYVHKFTGVHLSLYNITDWLSLVPLGFIIGFALLGLIQWIKRKSIKKVDYRILVLGGFYIIVMAVYLFFETVIINYRPVLINGYLESSYPSSTTMLVMCVMPTAIMQFINCIKNKMLKRCISISMSVFTAFMVVARFVSGVHWFTDIVGGALLSTSLVILYYSVLLLKE